MSKIFKKRINIKRKENINKRLMLQVIFSIVLVVAVIATKQFGSNYAKTYINNAKEKFSKSIDVKLALSNIKFSFQTIAKKFSLSSFTNLEYTAPVRGKIHKKYGIDKTLESAEYNHGIDIISNMESVKAIASGKVTLVGNNRKLSNYIVVENNNKKIIYAMFDEVFVNKGEQIKLGEIIGKLSNDKKLLHIEVWENGESINPSKLFKIYE